MRGRGTSWQHGGDEAEARDLIRTSEIQRCGFRVIRFWNHEVIERVWNELYAAPTLALPLEGEGKFAPTLTLPLEGEGSG